MIKNTEEIMATFDRAYKSLGRWEVRSATNDNPVSALIFVTFLKFVTDNREKLSVHIEELYTYDYITLLYGQKVYKDQIVEVVREIEEQLGINNKIISYYAENLKLLELKDEFRELLFIIKELDLRDDKSESVVINHLINYIMIQSKKELRFAGEFTTDDNLSRLMSSVCQIKSGMKVYDFACGYGILLALAAQGKDVEIYAQDINHISSAVSAMLLIMGFNTNINITCDNSLQHPITLSGNVPKQFDAVLSSPPLGIKVSPGLQNNYELHEAFMYGMDLTTKGDLVFVQHLLASLKNDGRGVIILPMGALFRGGREESLRKRIIEDGFIKAVIELPQGSLAPYTAVKAAIVLLSKQPKDKNVLFINLDSDPARGYIERSGRTSVKITYEGVEEIAKIVIEERLVEGLSRKVDIEQIINNNSNLCPGTYLTIAEIKDVEVKDTEELINKNNILINKLVQLDQQFNEIIEDI